MNASTTVTAPRARNTETTVLTPAGRALRVPPPVAAVAFVPSDSRANLRHAVMCATIAGRQTWGCSCEAGSYRPERECKHVRAVRALTPPEGTQWTPEGYVLTGQVEV